MLAGVDLAIERGEIVTIVGPNGSGKTRCCGCSSAPSGPGAGRIERAPGLRIGYVPQRLAVDATLPMTVAAFSGSPGGGRRRAAEALDAGRASPGSAGGRSSALSGGQFQRALLAQALLGGRTSCVLDEAAQGLDQPGEARFYRLIEQLRAELGCGVLMVSHDLHVVMAASDRVICLNGHVCCEGTPTVVSAAPEYRALFGVGTQGALALYRHDHDHGQATDGHARARARRTGTTTGTSMTTAAAA